MEFHQCLFPLTVLLSWMSCAFAFSVDIVTLGNVNLQTLGSLPLSGPAIDMAVSELRIRYKDVFTVRHSYLFDPAAVTCDDVASVADDLVAGFYYRKNTTFDMTVFISVGCTEQEQIARLSYEWNLSVIYGSTTAVSSRKRNTYPQMILAGPGSGYPYMVFSLRLAAYFNWTMIYIAYHSPSLSIYQEAATNLALTLRLKPTNQIRLAPVDCTTWQSSMEFLQDFRQNARIVAFIGHPKCMRQVMIQAERANMTNGDFVFFFSEFLKGTNLYGTLSWQEHDQYDAVAQKAFGAVLLITYYENTVFDSEAFRMELKLRSQRDYNYTYKPDEQPNIVAVAMYRCFQMFGMVLAETLSSNVSWNSSDGAAFMQKFRGRTFSLPGESIYIDKTGERLDELVVYNFDPISGTRTAVFRQDKSTFTIVPLSSVQWPGKWPPPSRPVCGFSGTEGPCSVINEDDALLKGVSCAGALVISIMMGISIRYVRMWMKFRERPWEINPADVCYFPSKPRHPDAANHQSTAWLTSNASFGGTRMNIQAQPSGDKFLQVRFAGYKDRKIVLQSAELISDEKLLTSLLAKMYPLTHVNVNQFYGILRKGDEMFLVSEYCPRGSLKGLLEHNQQFREPEFLQGLLSDVLSGMKYIHDSPLHYHGNLDSGKCWLGHNFTVKIAEAGFSRLRTDEPMYLLQQPSFREEKKKAVKELRCQAEDVLAIGLIAIEIFRPAVWRISHDLEMSINYLECAAPMKELLRKCVKERYQERPSMGLVEKSFFKLCTNRSFMERVLRRMEKYSQDLENSVAERTDELNAEKRNCDKLLLEMLPPKVVETLRLNRTISPETFDSVTISFTDICGFAEFIGATTPLEVVSFLNDSHSMLDGILHSYDVYKVETINDSYFVASGLPQKNGTHHAEEICRLAKHIRSMFAENFAQRSMQARTGIHSGPCVTAVIGTKRPRYCLFGDTVNTASRMETSGEGGRIQLTLSTGNLIRSVEGLPVTFRAILHIKGKGHMQTFWLD